MRLEKKIEAVLIFGTIFLFFKVSPENLIDGVPLNEKGWKSPRHYYVFPAIFSFIICLRLIKFFFVKSFFTQTIGRVADDETGEKDVTIIYDHHGEQYACIYEHSKDLQPDWPIKVYVHPKNHNIAVFDLWMHTKSSLIWNGTILFALLAIHYYSTTPITLN